MTRCKKIVFGSLIAVILGGTLIACNTHRHHGDPEKHMNAIVEKITDRLDLRTDQVSQLEALKDEVLQVVKEAKSKHREKHQEIENMLTQPTLDQDRLLALVQEKTTAINNKAPTIIAAMAGFYDSLTPEQQAELLEKIQKHKKRHGHWFHD